MIARRRGRIREGILQPLSVVDFENRPQHVGDRQQRYVGSERQARPAADEDALRASVTAVLASRDLPVHLARDQQEPTRAPLEVPADRGQLRAYGRRSGSAPRDPLCLSRSRRATTRETPTRRHASASTMPSSTPQVGIRDEEKTLDTVVWLHPASRAMRRRLGHPAW